MLIRKNYAESCERVAKELGVSPEIHVEDFIFHFMVEHPNIGPKGKAAEEYFNNRLDSARKLYELLTKVCGFQGKPVELLEFASGYGCVSRHIPNTIPLCNLTACDIHEQATTFLKDKMNIEVILSTSVPEELSIGKAFDVVFALSFFSHMPKTSFSRWLQRLASFVKPGGFIIFTTHGMVSRKVCFENCKLDGDGFYFHPSSEQKDLSKSEYGNAVAAPKYLFNLIENSPNLSLKLFQEGFWWGHQDLYVVEVSTEQVEPIMNVSIIDRIKNIIK